MLFLPTYKYEKHHFKQGVTILLFKKSDHLWTTCHIYAGGEQNIGKNGYYWLFSYSIFVLSLF